MPQQLVFHLANLALKASNAVILINLLVFVLLIVTAKEVENRKIAKQESTTTIQEELPKTPVTNVLLAISAMELTHLSPVLLVTLVSEHLLKLLAHLVNIALQRRLTLSCAHLEKIVQIQGHQLTVWTDFTVSLLRQTKIALEAIFAILPKSILNLVA